MCTWMGMKTSNPNTETTLPYSVTVDINAYITRAVKSNEANIKKNDFVKIFSFSLELFIK